MATVVVIDSPGITVRVEADEPLTTVADMAMSLYKDAAVAMPQRFGVGTNVGFQAEQSGHRDASSSMDWPMGAPE